MPRSSTKKVTKKTTKKRVAKTAKKKTVKKAASKTAKKTTKKSVAPKDKVLVCAEGEQCFWTNDGQVLKDLQELSEALNEMQQTIYAHHVTSERNDFADWVEHVLCDGDCAQKLRRSRSKRGAHGVVIRQLRLYS